MRSWIGPAGAVAFTAVVVVTIMTVLLLFPLGLGVVVPGARLTDNWTLLTVSLSGLAMFLAGLAVTPLVRALGLFAGVFRHRAVALWTKRVIEFLMMVGWYHLFVGPLAVAVAAAVVACVFTALTEPLLDRLLARQRASDHAH